MKVHLVINNSRINCKVYPAHFGNDPFIIEDVETIGAEVPPELLHEAIRDHLAELLQEHIEEVNFLRMLD